MDSPFQSPVVLSLCPGFLGLERGLQRAIGKINIVAYVEIETFIVANLIAGMEAGMVDPAPVWTDVKTFDAKPFRKKIHGIIGGYPCQPFSLAGQRKGHEDPRHLWPYIHGIIKTTGPVWCFFENVSGHLSMGYDQVYKDLRDLGYAVEAGIYTAEEAGAPHERERLFILAISRSFLGYTRRKRIRWEAWANISGSSKGAELVYSGSVRSQWAKKQTAGIEQSDKTVANADSQSRQQATTTRLGMDGIVLQKFGWHQDTNGLEPFSKKKLGNTNSRRCEQFNPEFWLRFFIGERSEQMANTHINGSGENLQPSKLWPSGFEQSPDNNWIANEAENNKGRFYGWPAGPGQQQYEWEEPRTIEPRMGSSINGYNFREDLLRALGNSVVEHTAEVAIIDLLNKFNTNY